MWKDWKSFVAGKIAWGVETEIPSQRAPGKDPEANIWWARETSIILLFDQGERAGHSETVYIQCNW